MPAWMLIREESLWTILEVSPLEVTEEKSQAAGCCNHRCGTSAAFWQSALHRPADLEKLRKLGVPSRLRWEHVLLGMDPSDCSPLK